MAAVDQWTGSASRSGYDKVVGSMLVKERVMNAEIFGQGEVLGGKAYVLEDNEIDSELGELSVRTGQTTSFDEEERGQRRQVENTPRHRMSSSQTAPDLKSKFLLYGEHASLRRAVSLDTELSAVAEALPSETLSASWSKRSSVLDSGDSTDENIDYFLSDLHPQVIIQPSRSMNMRHEYNDQHYARKRKRDLAPSKSLETSRKLAQKIRTADVGELTYPSPPSSPHLTPLPSHSSPIGSLAREEPVKHGDEVYWQLLSMYQNASAEAEALQAELAREKMEKKELIALMKSSRKARLRDINVITGLQSMTSVQSQVRGYLVRKRIQTAPFSYQMPECLDMHAHSARSQHNVLLFMAHLRRSQRSIELNQEARGSRVQLQAAVRGFISRRIVHPCIIQRSRISRFQAHIRASMVRRSLKSALTFRVLRAQIERLEEANVELEERLVEDESRFLTAQADMEQANIEMKRALEQYEAKLKKEEERTKRLLKELVAQKQELSKIKAAQISKSVAEEAAMQSSVMDVHARESQKPPSPIHTRSNSLYTIPTSQSAQKKDAASAASHSSNLPKPARHSISGVKPSPSLSRLPLPSSPSTIHHHASDSSLCQRHLRQTLRTSSPEGQKVLRRR